MINKKSRIYIAGHTGMVGHSLIATLKTTGYENLVLTTRAKVDLTNSAQLQAFFAEYSIDVVILLAAKVGGIQANIANPTEFYLENTLIATNVIQAAWQAGVHTLLNIGSSCMYPAGRAWLSETDLMTGSLEPTNQGYALAKIGAAELCRAISQQYKLSYKTLIPCNLYGPYDNFHPEKSHMISAAIRKVHHAKQSGETVEIWGDGKARREFMFVDDLSDCILQVIERIEATPQMMNVGLGQDHTIQEYYDMIAKVLGYQGEYQYDLSKPVGMKRKRLNVDRATKWGWQYKTSLEQGIAKTYDYFRSIL